MISLRKTFVFSNKKDVLDVISLYLVALVNLFMPLFFMPYFSRVVGLDKFGDFAVYASVTQYLMILVDFGSTTPLVNQIIKSGCVKKASDALFSVVVFRLIVTMVVAFIFLFLVCFFSFKIDVFVTIMFILFGVAINPYSLFQAHSLLPKFALINVAWRVLISILIYNLLNEKSSVSMLLSFQFMSISFASISAIIYLKYKGFLVLRPISLNTKKYDVLFSESISFLTGSFFSSGYTISLPIIIQMFFGSAAAGVYGLFDRLIQPVKQIFNPIINVLYPKVCLAFSENYQKGLRVSCMHSFIIGSGAFIGLLIGLMLSEQISIFLFNLPEYGKYVRLIVINIFFVYLSQAVLFFFVTPMGVSRLLKYIYLALFFLFVSCSVIAVYTNEVIYIYLTLVIVELCGFCLLSFVVMKRYKTLYASA